MLESARPEESIEVALTTLPARRPEAKTPKPTPPPAPKPPRPVQPTPKLETIPAFEPVPKPKPPAPKPKPVKKIQPPPPPPKPRLPEPEEPKPVEPPLQPPTPGVPEPAEPIEPPASEPSEPTEPKPGKQKRKSTKAEPVPEFKDDFAQLSNTYDRDNLANQGRLAESNQSKADTGIKPGSILNINPRIFYPREAMRRNLQGVVVVLIHISPDGHADGVDLIQSSGHEELDDQVLGAVQHWRFKPPMRGNIPVAGTYKHRVIFGANEQVIDDFTTHWRDIKLFPAQ